MASSSDLSPGSSEQLALICQNQQRHSEAINNLTTTVNKNAFGEVDYTAPINVQIAQAKTLYCKYLVVIQHLTTTKLQNRAAELQTKADEKLAKVERTKDKEAAKEAVKEARKAQQIANDAKEAAEKQARRATSTEAKVKKTREAKPQKAGKVKKDKVNKSVKKSEPDTPTLDELAAAAE